MRIIELFAGIGACSKALENLGLDIEIVDAVEIDKYAIASFNAIHGTNFEPQDITKWDKDFKDIELITHGSPCQDFSAAGKQQGGDKDSGTRSSLMYETLRIVEKIRPKYVLWENVKNILSKKHRHNFDNYLSEMERLGYTNYYQVLNAKDYGIPQNRERVFTISILENSNYEFPKGNKNNNGIKRLFNFSARQDCRVVYDSEGIAPTLVAGMGEGGGKVPMFIENENFVFPEKQELKLRLKDMLEDNVDEKYYLSNAQIDKIKASTYIQNQRRIQEKDYCDTLCARDWKDPKCVQVANLKGGKWDKINESCRRIYSAYGISPTVHTCQGGNTEPKVAIEKVNIPQIVKVRKYQVDTKNLVECLRKHKELKKYTNSFIANYLNVPLTKVEHWFRNDNSFAIPDSEIWLKLKDLLGINENTLDLSIMTFEEKEGIYEKANRCYYEDGISPTITCESGEEKIITSAAQRGRNPSNPNDRTKGCPTEQRIEISDKEVSNCITTVQKDSMICEKKNKTKKVCKICGEKHKGLGYCNKHYLRYKKYGNPLFVYGKEEVVK